MIINNKKNMGLLILTTALFSGYYLVNNKIQKQDPDVMNEKLIQQYSTEINAKLPLTVNPFYSLVNTKVGHISPTIPTLDFYYSLKVKENEVKDFNVIVSHTIKNSCETEFTKSLIDQNAILRHQFVTTDKSLMPLIGVSKVDCFLLEKNNTEVKDKK